MPKPDLTKLDWLTDVSFHTALLLLVYWLGGKDKIIRNYLLSLLILSLVFSYYLKQETNHV